MSTFPTDEAPTNPSYKGKARAEDATERTPLLSDSPRTRSIAEVALPETDRPSLRARLTFVFVASLTFCTTTFIVLGLLAYSYAARVAGMPPDSVMEKAVVFRGVERLDVLNVTSTGDIWVSVSVRMGVDAGSIIGVNRNQEEDSPITAVWKAVGRWGIRQLNSVSVDLSTIHLRSEHQDTPLGAIEIQPLNVPLTADPPLDDSWLADFSTTMLVQPTKNSSTLLAFVRDTWKHGAAEVHADIRRISVHGGGLKDATWRSMINQAISNVQQSARMQIPPLPGLPQPGHQPTLPPITLKEFEVSSGPSDLTISAAATLFDPIPPTFNLTSPSFPFTVALPAPNNTTYPLASISTRPFCLTHPNITLGISGKVLPLPKEGARALSTLVSRFLSRKSNRLIISTPLVSTLAMDVVIPGPRSPPRVLRNVTIQDMRVRLSGTTPMASGTVVARIVLPKGVNIDLSVSRALPDVLVFDGPVPDNATWFAITEGGGGDGNPPPHPGPEPMPLPDPLPERAFGHIRPDDWLNATSYRAIIEPGEPPAEDGEEGLVYIVTSNITDVPFQVLPGRKTEFSRFVRKVIFGSDGAIAGILGSAAVSVHVEGLPLPGSDGEIELSGLPFRGAVPIRKKTALSENLLDYAGDVCLGGSEPGDGKHC